MDPDLFLEGELEEEEEEIEMEHRSLTPIPRASARATPAHVSEGDRQDSAFQARGRGGLAKRMESGDKEAAGKAGESNLRLVVSIAKRYVGPGMQFWI